MNATLNGLFSVLAVTALMSVGAPKASADVDDFDVPKSEWLLINSLDSALQAANFSDCLIQVQAHGMSFDHGVLHAWVNFFNHHTTITPTANSVVVIGYEPAREDDGWLQNNLTFTLSADQKSIVSATFVQSSVDHVNTGTVNKPAFKIVMTPLSQVTCVAQ